MKKLLHFSFWQGWMEKSHKYMSMIENFKQLHLVRLIKKEMLFTYGSETGRRKEDTIKSVNLLLLIIQKHRILREKFVRTGLTRHSLKNRMWELF